MATYYPGSSGHSDAITALCPSNSYSEPAISGNRMYINYSTSSAFSDSFAEHHQSPQNCGQLPVAGSMLSHNTSLEVSRPTASYPDTISNSVASRLGVNISNVWQGSRNEMFVQPRVTLTSMQGIREQINIADDLVGNHDGVNQEVRMGTHLGILQGGQCLQPQHSDATTVQGRGLSLSLGSEMPSAVSVSSFQRRQENLEVASCGDDKCTSKSSGTCRSAFAESVHIIKGDLSSSLLSPVMKHMDMNPSTHGLTEFSNAITNSKYLRAAQQLLDEVVYVGNALKPETNRNHSFRISVCTSNSKERKMGTEASGNPLPIGAVQESAPSATIALPAAESQELQTKLTQLLSMLDEVDRRYQQYYHQMQIVVSSFDVVAGRGAAKTYTALALQTISRHFRCLRDAINAQIRACRKRLGEEEPLNEKGAGLTRLRLLDQQIRQQKALQQLGMIQQHSWRPQRGLPESSVSTLRAWLFEHFLHPYPNESDKLMLARQTGLSRSQVSNWFINARVRLWKPMVEEMYKEEIGDTEVESNCSSENAPKDGNEKGDAGEKEFQENPHTAGGRKHASPKNGSKSDIRTDGELCSSTPDFNNNLHVEDSSNSYGDTFNEQRSVTDQSNIFQDALWHSDTGGRFISYQMAGFGRYGNDVFATNVQATSGVSLTLGLQHCDGGVVSVSTEQNLVPTSGDNICDGTLPHANTSNYAGLNMGNRRHRFGPSPVLHDFVA